ncbi:MAG: LCP family protein [Anaerolineales bacterium]|nr:LCP family protein [Anaerolineales bacterium]
MKARASGGLLLAVITMFACTVPSTLQPTSQPATAEPNTTATPTPFGPAAPTATPDATEPPQPTPSPSPDPSQPWGSFPAPSVPSAIEVPPPAEPIDFDSDVVNVLLLGSDYAPHRGGGYRTDTMMIVSLNPGDGTATLISVPRDLYVYVPGWRMDRINTADPRGGPELAAQTILYNFGIPIHHYARMNFSGFMSLVNSLGGIDVQVTGNLYDECGGTWYRYSPGTYHMNGFTALCYVRMRKASSDFDRLRRQQEVIQAIFRKVLSLDGLRRAPELYQQFSSLVETDVRLDRAIRLLPLASHLANNPSAVNRLTIDATMARSWRVPFSGAAVLLPDRPSIEAALRSSLGS